MNRPFYKLLLFVVFLACLGTICAAQTFNPDRSGYVVDPAFKKLITQRGYQLVSAFDTVSKKPLVVAAKVMINDKFLTMDNHGKIISDPDLPFRRSSDMSAGFDEPGIPDIREASGEDKSAYSIVNINGKYGTVEKNTGKQGLPASYDYIGFYMPGILQIRVNEKLGLATAEGKIIKQPQYENMQGARYGYGKHTQSLIEIKKNGKYGLLNEKGEDILQPLYDQIRECGGCDVKQQLLLIANDKKYGLATKSGKVIIEPVYDNISPLTFKGQMKITVGKAPDVKYGAIDSTGKVILEPVYSKLKYGYKSKFITLTIGKLNNELQGVAEDNGKIILQPVYTEIRELERGLWVVTVNKKNGVMNQAGARVMEPIYDHLYIYNDYPYISAESNGKYGISSLEGKPIFATEYDMLIPNQKGFIFNKDNKWGIMTAKRKTIAMLDFDRITPASGYLVIEKDHKAGVADLEGNVIVPLKYDRFMNTNRIFRQGLAEAVRDGAYYVIDRYGNEYASRRR